MADLEVVRRLAAADQGLAIVCTTRSDHTVQTSLVNAGVTTHPVDDRDVVAFVPRGDAVKLPHLRRRPYANVVFRAGWEWVSVEGAATLIGPDDSAAGFDLGELPALLRAIFVRGRRHPRRLGRVRPGDGRRGPHGRARGTRADHVERVRRSPRRSGT